MLGPASISQEASVQLDSRLQLGNSSVPERCVGRLRSGSVLPRNVAGRHRKTILVWRSRGLDPSGRGANRYGLFGTCRRISVYSMSSVIRENREMSSATHRV